MTSDDELSRKFIMIMNRTTEGVRQLAMPMKITVSPTAFWKQKVHMSDRAWWRHRPSGNVVGRINEVALRDYVGPG